MDDVLGFLPDFRVLVLHALFEYAPHTLFLAPKESGVIVLLHEKVQTAERFCGVFSKHLAHSFEHKQVGTTDVGSSLPRYGAGWPEPDIRESELKQITAWEPNQFVLPSVNTHTRRETPEKCSRRQQ